MGPWGPMGPWVQGSLGPKCPSPGPVWAGSSLGAGLQGKPNPPGAALSQNARFRAEGQFSQGPVLKQGLVYQKKGPSPGLSSPVFVFILGAARFTTRTHRQTVTRWWGCAGAMEPWEAARLLAEVDAARGQHRAEQRLDRRALLVSVRPQVRPAWSTTTEGASFLAAWRRRHSLQGQAE